MTKEMFFTKWSVLWKDTPSRSYLDNLFKKDIDLFLSEGIVDVNALYQNEFFMKWKVWIEVRKDNKLLTDFYLDIIKLLQFYQ